MLPVQKLGFYVVKPGEPIQAVIRQAGRDYWVVVEFEPGQTYAILKKKDLEEAIRRLGVQASRLVTTSIGPMVMPLALPPLLESMEPGAARREAVSAAYGLRVVVDAQGKLAGLFAGESSRPQPMTVDAGMVEQLLEWLAPTASMGIDEGGVTVAKDVEDIIVVADKTEEEGKRKIYTTLQDADQRFYDAEHKPLQKGDRYRLGFDVDRAGRTKEVLSGTDFDEAKVFRGGEEQVTLQVHLSSLDFKMDPAEQAMTIPRKGQSQRIWFQIEPLHEGPCVLNAIFTKEHNLIQSLTLRFHTGPLVSVEEQGRVLSQAFGLARRDVNLTILNQGNGTFSLTLTGSVAATATLAVTPILLDAWVRAVRKCLVEEVVDKMVDGAWVYQEGIDIPEAVNQEAVLRVAIEGWRLYNNLFFGSGADEQTRLMGKKLLELTKLGKLNIQIFSKDFVLPWSVLYLAEQKPRLPGDVKWENFLGMKHIVEHIPLQQGMRVLDSTIHPAPLPQVGLMVNEDLDAEAGQPVATGQIAEWEKLAKTGIVSLQIRRRSRELLEALEVTEGTQDQIMYFFCHAVSRSLAEADGPGSSLLELTGGGSLRLDELQENLNVILPGSPLVFLNACESAELSPQFYAGFVPYFMDKGARGVVGTECKIPALFGREWARRFFERFLAGEALGEIVLELRREFYTQHHNLLGLVYALYADGDTRIGSVEGVEF